MSSPTEARLRSLAAMLCSGTPEDIDALWNELKGKERTKELYALKPKAVEAIVKFAKMKASGNLTGGLKGYNEMCGKAIEKAVGRAG